MKVKTPASLLLLFASLLFPSCASTQGTVASVVPPEISAPTTTPIPTKTLTPSPTQTPTPLAMFGVIGGESRLIGWGRMYSLSFSSDGARAAILTSNGLYLYTADLATPIWSQARPRTAFYEDDGSLAWSPDGRMLAATIKRSTDGKRNIVSIIDAGTGEFVKEIIVPKYQIEDLAWLFDNQSLLVSASSNGTYLFDTASGKQLFYDDDIRGGRLSPDGKTIASISFTKMKDSDFQTCRCGISLWDVETLEAVGELSDHETRLLPGSAAWSPSGGQIAAVTGTGIIQIWEVASNTLLRTIQTVKQVDPEWGDPAEMVRWSPDGTILAYTNGWGAVKLYRPSTGMWIMDKTLSNTLYKAKRIFWLPESPVLLMQLIDSSLVYWSAESQQEILRTQPTIGEPPLAWSPDGRTIASNSTYTSILLWDAESGMPVLPIPCLNPYWLSWSPDGKTIAASFYEEKTVKLFDASTGEELKTYLTSAKLTRIAWSPDGKKLASGSYNNIAYVWDVGEQKETHLQYHLLDTEEFLEQITWSPDSRYLASVSGNFVAGIPRDIVVWDVETGDKVLTIPDIGPRGALSWSPDGKFIAAGSVSIWDASTGKFVRSYSGHEYFPDTIAFSPDGQYLLSISSADHAFFIWNVSTGSLLRKTLIPVHKDWLSFASWSPTGDSFVTAGQGSIMEIWPFP